MVFKACGSKIPSGKSAVNIEISRLYLLNGIVLLSDRIEPDTVSCAFLLNVFETWNKCAKSLYNPKNGLKEFV